MKKNSEREYTVVRNPFNNVPYQHLTNSVAPDKSKVASGGKSGSLLRMVSHDGIAFQTGFSGIFCGANNSNKGWTTAHEEVPKRLTF